MKKLKKICAILMFVGLGIVIFNGVFLDNNIIMGLIGLIMFIVPILINIFTRDKEEKVNNKKPVEEIKKSVSLPKLSKKDMEIVEYINGINTFYDCCDEILAYKADGAQQDPETNWIKLNDDKKIEKALLQYAYVKDYFDKNNSYIFDFFKYNNLALAWLWSNTFLVINGEELNLSNKKKEKIISLCKNNDVTVVSQNKNVFKDVFTADRYILSSYTYPGSADDAATYVQYDLQKISG